MKRAGLCLSVLLIAGLVTISPAAAAQGDYLWRSDVAYTWSAPVVIGDFVYMQDQEGAITCFRTSDGSQVWQTRLASEFPTTSPTYRDGKLYAMAGSGLYEIDAADGTVLNTFTANGSLGCMAPAVTAGKVFVSTSSTLYAVDTATFTASWTQSVSAVANVIVSGDVVYALSDNLYALSAADGTEYWRVSPPRGNHFNLGTLSGGYIAAFSAYDSSAGTTQLHAYLLSTDIATAPAPVWSADMGVGQYSDTAQPASDGTYVFAASREGVLRCFQLGGDGTAVWTRIVRDAGSASAIPAVVGGKVFIQDNDSAETAAALVCLNAADGSELWKTSLGDMQISWGSPAIVDNVAYLATDHGGGLLAFDAGTVSSSWHMAGDNPSLTASDNGWTPSTSNGGGSSCTDLVKVTGVSVSGTNRVNTPMTIQASASNDCGGTIYYRFGLVQDYGTASYDPANWVSISDYTTSNSISHTFTEAGSYIFTVTASSSPVEPSGAKPLMGGCITILE